jgi:hypothetical protein
MAELQNQVGIRQVAAQGVVRHIEVAVHEKHELLAVPRRQSQPFRHAFRDPPPHLPVVLFEALSQIVQQQSEVQDLLVPE